METPVTESERHLAGADAGSVRILYVDADEDASSRVAAALSAIGSDVTVHTATSSDDALDCLASAAVDCVVSEYALPDNDGVALLRRVRKQFPDLPFVLFTDVGSEAVASEAIGFGATDYLPKEPFEEQSVELGDRVSKAVVAQSERESMLDRMTDAFFALDESWAFTYLNETGREIINTAARSDEPFETGQLLGQNLWEVVPDAVGSQFEREYREAMSEQTARTFESYYEPLETWFEVRVYPSPRGLSVYFQDVTERHERQQSLAERERILKEMYRIVADKELSFEEKVDHLLDIGRGVLGTEYAALSHVDGDDYVFDIVHDPDGETEPGDVVPLDATNCERAIVTEETLVLSDIASQAPDLTERAGFAEQGICCYLGTPVDVDGEVTGTFCFFDREVREEPFSDWEVTLVDLMGNWVSHERERRRRNAELTRERNRLEDFASLISHDLRNPLNLAVGRLELVAQSYGGDPDHLDAVERALDRMEALIDDVLTLTRSGEYVVETTTVDVETVVGLAWETAGNEVGTVTVDDDLTYIEGDRNRLAQLFENLFRNSVEHGSTSSRSETDDGVEHVGPEVTVRVGALSDGDGFYVADDGPGIPADEREQVRETGYTTHETGTGFGLRIVEEIAQAHGGELAIRESDTGGARFEIPGVPTR